MGGQYERTFVSMLTKPVNLTFSGLWVTVSERDFSGDTRASQSYET